jgi:hypothetical protein
MMDKVGLEGWGWVAGGVSWVELGLGGSVLSVVKRSSYWPMPAFGTTMSMRLLGEEARVALKRVSWSSQLVTSQRRNFALLCGC